MDFVPLSKRIAEDIECSLIVMASTQPEHQDYFLGPNAARVVRHAKCSVLVVRD
ncbi:MAG TPA: universal stress protein [Rhodospirillales bacterium]|jgi:nucleotide-binding universal stress UspA family protein|nr:universal stress protein [Rhodospirillales bacterium]